MTRDGIPPLLRRDVWGSDVNREKERSSLELLFTSLAERPQAGAAQAIFDLEPTLAGRKSWIISG
jgi:hypothetical protein